MVAGSTAFFRPYPRQAVSDASALPQHYRRLLAPIRAKCRRILGDPSAAEDAAQETFLRLCRSGPSFSADPQPDDARTMVAWLYRTCTRVAIDVLRDRRRSASLASGSWDPLSGCRVDGAQALEARSMLARIAASLPDDEIEIALLCRVDGLTHPEAAEVMGISERTVRRLLDRFDERVAEMRKEGPA
jgi:RNA polymerase sigma-70 factor (ECF subfamily)